MGDDTGNTTMVNPNEIEAKKRADAKVQLTSRIEKEFEELKEKVFAGKTKELSKENQALLDAARENFIKKMDEGEAKKREKLRSANKWREYQLQNITHTHDSEVLQAEQEFEAERQAIKTKMASDLLERQKKLDEEREAIIIAEQKLEKKPRTTRPRKRSNSVANSTNSNTLPPVVGIMAGDKGDDRNFPTGDPPVPTLTPIRMNIPGLKPNIIYTLKDDEILEDIERMKKGPPGEGKMVQDSMEGNIEEEEIMKGTFEGGEKKRIRLDT
eukprot:TRINITY_DN6730_c0_g1_i1.p1 TRINITY_DN6730_c0_g1~~TRINITY_DN6730_c0_g1_i1.p1  ORF type:complete len:270 (-),score=84.94 TRINITY_DN6730_c0_g1_i1:103-912(-)